MMFPQQPPTAPGTAPRGAEPGGVGSVALTLPLVPPTVLTPNARPGHWAGRSAPVKQLRQDAGWALSQINPAPIRCPVALAYEVVWPTGRRRVDCDALAYGLKAVQDALVDRGVIRGDGPNDVVEVSYRQSRAPNGEEGRTIVVITPVGGQARAPTGRAGRTVVGMRTGGRQG